MNLQEAIAELEKELSSLEESHPFPKPELRKKMEAMKQTIRSLYGLERASKPSVEEVAPTVSFNPSENSLTITSQKDGKDKVDTLQEFVLITKHKNSQWYVNRTLTKGLKEKMEWMSTYYSLTVYVKGLELVSYHTGLRENIKHFVTAIVREFPVAQNNVFEETPEGRVIYAKDI